MINQTNRRSKKIEGEITITKKDLDEIRKTVNGVVDLKKRIEEKADEELTKIVKEITAGAIVLDSSDIHIEVEEERVKLRLRIDGILHDVLYINKKLYNRLLSRIKLLSGLKLNVEDRPQDGRFSIKLKSTEIETRASTLPGEYGESIVIRLLNPEKLISIEDLGLRKDLYKLFLDQINQPNGMIIVTGPTGSGKTTTLYSFLKKINEPEVKIITLEDPVEYHLPGIVQTQVKKEKGYTFAKGLRSVVRQDPDTILVGEIRDKETVQIALQAALTGHLVFSTVHTNDAAGTVARLDTLGAKLSNIAPAINLVIAQRLVRTICDKCAKERKITEEEYKKLKEARKNINKDIDIPKVSKDMKLKEGEGCKHCNFTGYKGRLGIFEAITIDDKMEDFILTNPSISALRSKALERGLLTMYQDGIIKVLNKKTTLEEVERVTKN